MRKMLGNDAALAQARTRLPFLPGSRVPYYWFIGQKV